MELFENKVGRPSNETIKKRRIFVASIALAVAVVLFAGCYALFGVKTGNLQGATYKSGTAHTDLMVYENKIKINGCKVTIPVTVKNNLKNELTINTASLHYNGGKELQNVSVKRKIGAKTKVGLDLTFDISKFKNTDASKYRYKVTIYNQFSGKGYYYDYDLFDNKRIQTLIKQCKNILDYTPYTGSYKSGIAHTDLSVYENKITINGCNVTIPITVKNNLKNELTVQSASLYYNGGKEIQKVAVNKKASKGTKISMNLKFDLRKITNYNSYRYKVTIWNKFSGKGYYYDYDLFDNQLVRNAAKSCKTK